ncbi:uncharacterized protein BDZ99DRAFT_521219 [Mytilinidion resinicola]|uniref:RING-type domain-containing protein n=1 Tax=Mytilinidion resinicola TaxID=574789 RepID=A0A6A6YIU6_9PEZI|nr:uncharacterized protein BDZ99DRAFT_521219 [Mytilinidion resinicola]KAF2808721.1 hypothetical protein BDZ99DRAFT_521219 [Mytilinidion resinicola]
MASSSLTPSTATLVDDKAKAMINCFLKDLLSYTNNPNHMLRGIDIFVRKVWAEPLNIWRMMVPGDVEQTKLPPTDVLEIFATFRENDSLDDQAARIPTSEMKRIQGFLKEGTRRWHPNYNHIMLLALLSREQRPYTGLSSGVLRLTEDKLKNFNWYEMRWRWEPHIQRLKDQGRNIDDEFYEAFYDGGRDWPADKLELVVLTNCFWQLIWQGVDWDLDGSIIPPATFLMMGIQDEMHSVRGLEEMRKPGAEERLRDLRRDFTLILHLLSRPLRKLRDDLAVLTRGELQRVRIIDKYSFAEAHVEEANILEMVTSPTMAALGDCNICLAAHHAADWVKTNNCSHIFGRECLETWFELRNTCPMCRKVFFVPADQLRRESLHAPRHDSSLIRPMLAFLAMCRTFSDLRSLINEVFQHREVESQYRFLGALDALITICGTFGNIMAVSPELRGHMGELGLFRIHLPGWEWPILGVGHG